MNNLFRKFFKITYTGAASTSVSKNPTLGLTIGLYKRATGNAKGRQLVANYTPGSHRFLRSRAARY